MNRAEFIVELTDKLVGLPIEERQAAVRYYEEYFEEAGPEREQEIVAELGSPTAVAASIMQDYSSVPIVTDRVAYNRQAATDWQQPQGDGNAETAQSAAATEHKAANAGSWERLRDWAESKMPLWLWVVVLVVALPIIGGLVSGVLGLVGGILGVVVSIAGVLLAAAATCFVACVAVGLLGITCVLGGLAVIVTGIVSFVASPAVGMLTIGVGALLMSLGLLITLLGSWIAIKLLPRAIDATVKLIRDVTSRIDRWARRVGKTK